MGLRDACVLPQTDAEEAVLNKKRSKKTEKKYKERQRTAKVETALEDQFMTGRVLGKDFVMNGHTLNFLLWLLFIVISHSNCELTLNQLHY